MIKITNHKNVDLSALYRDVIRGTSNGKIIWQLRILRWYGDRFFFGNELPEPYTGMDLPAI